MRVNEKSYAESFEITGPTMTMATRVMSSDAKNDGDDEQ
jgi:hypothetical protein